jgi:hypothetical protein
MHVERELSMSPKEAKKSPEPQTPFEEVLISCYKDRMIAYMHAHPEAYDEAAKLAVTDRQPFAWRAAWLLWSCISPNDRRIKKYINKFTAGIATARNNQKRELLKILLCVDLTEKQESKLFDQSIDIWKDIAKDPSIRLMAFKMLLKIAGKYPELKSELILLTDEHYLKTLSHGARHSMTKILRRLKVQ